VLGEDSLQYAIGAPCQARVCGYNVYAVSPSNVGCIYEPRLTIAQARYNPTTGCPIQESLGCAHDVIEGDHTRHDGAAQRQRNDGETAGQLLISLDLREAVQSD
jgi:hypothetical protein